MFSDSGNVPLRSVFSVIVSSESLIRINDEFFVRECVDTRIEHGCPSRIGAWCSMFRYPLSGMLEEVVYTQIITWHL
jgi:hypothetical protein